LQIVGVKYDESIYTPDLNRFERSNQNGLITLNAINQPGNIVTTLYEKDSRPRILANTTVPGNVAIETVELWSSSDNVNFELVGNLPPPGGGTYTTGDTVSFDFDRALTGNVYLKSRALNSSATGPYSNVAVIPYTPVQVTDAIGNNTGLLDGAGTSVATLLALQALLKGLDTYMNGDSNLGNAVGSQISSSGAGNATILATFDGPLVAFYSGNSASATLNGNIDVWEQYANVTFTVPNNTQVIFQMEMNGVAGSNFYANNFPINTTKLIELYGPGNVFINGTSTHSDPYDDLSLQAFDNVVTGGSRTYSIRTAVEEISANVLGASTSFIAFGRPL